MKTVRVAAAIIHDGHLIYVSQRGYGEMKDGWEFPGGKIEKGESGEEAVVREIKEEFDTVISVEKYVGKVEHDYPNFHLEMECYLCHIASGEMILKEAEDAKWMELDDLEKMDLLAADCKVLPMVRNLEMK